ncbi:MAG: hypothetical protein AMDU4_FER2C00006G0020 [Ferroplasma sp. Type II]|jgi:uncharacterized protein (DUF302 family)/SAM-dependent methyltransferase|uniref:methyltransferase domain-containing protein n=1 Tax=Ferroplasma sp. Type II TaxID=261388 RepID=UPI0003894E5E|nr:methyltransferase domain-containing protein [Ferroplasma acidiphilum]EQB74478.1 MAG: hypothetical protein AMDU4_FER2C00006G0020 [Ferroplasma sp. Type II]MCL4349801.1 methyltransferase domain-containing protein [Candidatus Thermoplasmatota archaeon]HII83175.1 methyltransferase domain-containing protein [Ferroplasma sp.]
MAIEYRIDSKLTFEEACSDVPAVVKKNGFAVLAEIKTSEILKSKGLDYTELRTYDICNAGFASRALAIDARLESVLPCHLIVKKASDHSEISVQLPGEIFHILSPNSSNDVEAFLDEVEKKLKGIVNSFGGYDMNAEKLGSRMLTPAVMKIMADNLNKLSQSIDPRTSPLYQKILQNLGPDRSIIDIGSGTGRFAIPLAQSGCSVTAIEPSGEMRKWLLSNAEKAGVMPSIKVVPDSWPTKETVRAEVTFASFVIQFADDPVEFIHAMERSASKKCILVVHVDHIFGFLKDIWPVFHPSDPLPVMLTFTDIYSTMLNMGIIADVSVYSEQREIRMPEPTQIMEMLSGLLGIRDNPNEIKLLKEMLISKKESIQQQMNIRTAIISWIPEG